MSSYPTMGLPPPAYGVPVGGVPVGVEVPFSSGLCDCFSDIPSCCRTCWSPCGTFGRIAEIVDRGSTSSRASGLLYWLIQHTTGHACIYSWSYRTRLRQQYLLEGSTIGDCLRHYFCESCALCQEYRELQSRGFDMSIGWHRNMQKQNQGIRIPTAPVMMEYGMDR